MKSKLLLIALISIFTLSGCTISFGQPAPAPSQSNTQNAANNQNASAANNQNQASQNNFNQDQNTQNTTSQPQAGANEVGIEKTVGNFKIKVNSVQIYKNDPYSKPQNGQWVILNLKVVNTSDQPEGLKDKTTLKNSNGQEALPTWNPSDITKVNYNSWMIDANSYYDDAILVYDISDGAPYKFTVEDNGETQTWTLQP